MLWLMHICGVISLIICLFSREKLCEMIDIHFHMISDVFLPFREPPIRVGKVELLSQWQIIPFNRKHSHCIFLPMMQRHSWAWTKGFHYPWTTPSLRHNLLVLVRILQLLPQSHIILEGSRSQLLTQILPLRLRRQPRKNGKDALIWFF